MVDINHLKIGVAIGYWDSNYLGSLFNFIFSSPFSHQQRCKLTSQSPPTLRHTSAVLDISSLYLCVTACSTCGCLPAMPVLDGSLCLCLSARSLDRQSEPSSTGIVSH